MKIKKSTSDLEIRAALSPEEILTEFDEAKAQANIWDAKRDRLRDYINDRIEAGRYGNWVLEKSLGTPRVSSNSAGNQYLQFGVIIEPHSQPDELFKPDMQVLVMDSNGIILLEGLVIDNKLLFNKTAPRQLKLVEIPADEK